LHDHFTYGDQELFIRIAKGDEKAFNEIFYRYHKRFYAAAIKMTHSEPVAEELVQDIFVVLWTRREQLQHIEKPFSYLFTSLYNSIYAYLKRIALEKQRIAGASLQMKNTNEKDTNETGEMLLLAKEQQRIIAGAVNQLPEQQRKVYHLIKQQGFSRDEVAKKLGISANTVRNHLSDAQKNLRHYLQKILPLLLFVLFSKS
jgi:RNA polymerase sigma-70 factor (ECF subfamily)